MWGAAVVESTVGKGWVRKSDINWATEQDDFWDQTEEGLRVVVSNLRAIPDSVSPILKRRHNPLVQGTSSILPPFLSALSCLEMGTARKSSINNMRVTVNFTLSSL